MIRKCFWQRYLNVGGKKTPYERGLMAVRDSAPLLPQNPTDNMHIEYSAEEIARRMTKVRLRHVQCEDRMEQALLQGEYKYFSGKKIHFRECNVPELISLLQNFAYFGFFSTKVLDEVVVELKKRVPELNCDMIERILRHLTTMHKLDEEFFDLLAAQLLSLLGGITAQDLASIIEVLHYVGSTSDALLVPVGVRAIEFMESLQPAHIAALSTCLARQSTRGKDIDRICYTILSRTLSVLHEFSALEAAQALWGLARIGFLSPTAHLTSVRKMIGRVTHSEADTTGEALALTMSALDKLECYDQDIVVALAMLTETRSDDFELVDAASSMLYFAKASKIVGLESVTEVAMSLFEQVIALERLGGNPTPTAVSTALRALALMGTATANDRNVTKLARGLTFHVRAATTQQVAEFLHLCIVHPWAATEAAVVLFLQRLQELFESRPTTTGMEANDRELSDEEMFALQCVSQLRLHSRTGQGLQQKIVALA